MGYVYVMETKDAVKIGITEHDVNRRKMILQTGCPYPIGRVWLSKNIPDYRECEKELHNIFSDKRLNGEWFDIDFTTASVRADMITRKHQVKYEERIRELEDRINYLESKMKDFEGM